MRLSFISDAKKSLHGVAAHPGVTGIIVANSTKSIFQPLIREMNGWFLLGCVEVSTSSARANGLIHSLLEFVNNHSKLGQPQRASTGCHDR
jgi:hypothetical protein